MRLPAAVRKRFWIGAGFVAEGFAADGSKALCNKARTNPSIWRAAASGEET